MSLWGYALSGGTYGFGYDTGVAKVPIVPAAVIFDLALGNSLIRPDAAMGYSACVVSRNTSTEQGNIGAGTGASVGKLLGVENSMKSGLGSATIEAGMVCWYPPWW